MKGCELCENQAKLYCDSEQARLCWDCDEKVHSANFLVAKHCRSLLCNVCQKPTPWKASGPKLSPTISLCENCFNGCHREEEINLNQPQRRHQEREEVEENDDEVYESETEDDDHGEYSTYSDSDDDDNDEVEFEDEDDDGENQVVPWSPSADQPSVASSSSSEEVAKDGDATVNISSTIKRVHQTAYLDFDDKNENECSSEFEHNAASVKCVTGMPSSSTYRPLKMARTSECIHQNRVEITKPENFRILYPKS